MNKLYRSTSDRMLAGVCGGLAEYIGMDSSLIRLALVLLILFGGTGVLAYIIAWIIIPEEPRGREEYRAPRTKRDDDAEDIIVEAKDEE